jgi:hypothetical protein
MPLWLAMLAMLVQFVASYGHFHPEQYDSLYHNHGVPSFAANHGPSRAIGDPTAADVDCQICASMLLLGSSALPEGVHIAPLLSRYVGVTAEIMALWLTLPRHLLFDTRGPPHI